jgi:hypothetical protein
MRLPEQGGMAAGVGLFAMGLRRGDGVMPSKAWWQPKNWSNEGCRAKCNWATAACVSACTAATAGAGLAGCIAACGGAQASCLGSC